MCSSGHIEVPTWEGGGKGSKLPILNMSKHTEKASDKLMPYCLLYRNKEAAINVVVLFTTTVKIYKEISSV